VGFAYLLGSINNEQLRQIILSKRILLSPNLTERWGTSEMDSMIGISHRVDDWIDNISYRDILL
jgi:hypothetical protein